MIIGAYILDLYCNLVESHKNLDGSMRKDWNAHFEASNIEKAKLEARQAGWKFTHNNDVLCPTHSKMKII